jgi:eukaryotic-like serine/threonine-protein kinase
MALAAGMRLGPYEIKAPLGAGGMGQVWQATDTRLGRSVALKLLPDAFASDPARLERFEREAKLLAALSHANVAGLFALEEARPDGAAGPVRFLAMELVLGEDLAERLRRGPIPPEEAIEVARQIAEALEEAHEKGIVHRDLKPANVKVTPDGKVKVLDFGLAKAWSDDAASGSAPDLSQSPTLAHTGTAAGLILGTAGYMSPEQARGRAVDKRADVWAFGVVLFEMLSGKRLFEGETVSDTLAAVLRQEIDWSALPSSTPPAIRTLLRRCLEREPKKRLRDIGEARIALTDGISSATTPSAPPVATKRAVVPWLVAAAALVAAAMLATRERAPVAQSRVMQLDVQLADDLQPGSLLGHPLALSPDGTRLVFVGLSGSEPALYLRTLDQPTLTLLPDTARAQQPFFSPDGSEVGFFNGNIELRRVSLAGGASSLIATGTGPRGASWGEDGTIVYSSAQSGALMRVSVSGGTPTPLTTVDEAKGERTHRWPSFLPGGRQLLFNTNAGNLSYDDAGIELVDLESGRRHALNVTGAAPSFAEGRLLFVRRGRLHAAPLDAATARLTSAPVVLARGVYSDLRSGSAHYAASQNGLIAFVQGQEPNAQRVVEWRDRGGKTTPFLERPMLYLSPRFSPDGRRVALQAGELRREDVYVAATAGGALTRLTLEDGGDFSPVWSPDGGRILYASVTATANVFSIRSADGSGTPRKVYETDPNTLAIPTAWSPDGASLLFHEGVRGTNLDVRLLDLASGKVRVLESTPVPELDASFSPDGRFVTYAAGALGGRQVYVRTLSDAGGHWQLSSDGGMRPVWLRTGEIVYQRPGRPSSDWISVPVRTSAASIVAGAPRVLFRGPADAEPLLRTWDVSPDGARFAVVQPIGTTAETPGVRVRLLLGWPRLLAAGAGEPQ